MSVNLIQANYDQLERIVAHFAQNAEDVVEMHMRIERAMQALQNGGWEGKGSAAFFAEMDSVVFPGVTRLAEALTEAQQVTLQIKDILQAAEEEAAAPFKQPAAPPLGPGTPPGFVPSGPPPDPFPPGGVSPGPYPINPPRSPSAKESSVWDHLRVKGELWSYDGKTKSGKFDPGIKATFGFEESSIWGKAKDGVAAVGGYGEAGFKASLQDGVMIGAGGEYYTVKGEWDTALVGDKEYGISGSAGFKGLSAEGFFGVQFDENGKRIGGTIGGTLVSVEGSVGGNIAGYNVSGTAEVGLKAELGFELGSKGVKVKLPFVSFGLKFGGGVD